MIRKHLNISVGIIATLSLLLFSCKAKSNQEKVLGLWEFRECWSFDTEAKGDFMPCPLKTNTHYEELNKIFRKIWFKDTYVFLSAKTKGLIEKNSGDTIKAFSYQFINDSTFQCNSRTIVARFEDKNHLLLISKIDSNAAKQFPLFVGVMKFERIK